MPLTRLDFEAHRGEWHLCIYTLSREIKLSMELLIKHESAPTAFVTNLAKALKKHVEDRGGMLNAIVEATLPEPFRRSVRRASRDPKILLVATQQDLESGWFRANVGIGSSEPIIAFFGDVDSGIVAAFGGLNFSSEADSSRHAFRALCQYLDGDKREELPIEPPLDMLKSNTYQGEPNPSDSTSNALYEEVFDSLEANPTLLLLAQSGRGERAFVENLHTRARSYYGADQVLNITPPSSLSLTLDEVFADLGRACGFQGIERQPDWEQALKDKIQSDGKVFLLIGRFEHASEDSRQALGKSLRKLSEELPWGNLHIVVSGGVGLAELKYIVADHSFLDHANSMLYPDLSVADLTECAHRDLQAHLDKAGAQALLARYGGHPGLLRQALGVLRRLETQNETDQLVEIARTETKYRWFDPYFLPFRRKPEHTKRVCAYLRQPESLGRFSYWPDDEVLHKLFWGNLIRKDGDQFQWRSPTIIAAGLEILGCNGSDPS